MQSQMDTRYTPLTIARSPLRSRSTYFSGSYHAPTHQHNELATGCVGEGKDECESCELEPGNIGVDECDLLFDVDDDGVGVNDDLGDQSTQSIVLALRELSAGDERRQHRDGRVN